VSIFFTKAEPHPSAALDEPRSRAKARLVSLMQTMSGQDFASAELDKLRTQIDSAVSASSDLSLAANYLHKAQRFIRSNEVGAAAYELRLVLDCLQCC